ncbi:hypothetical protein NPIL_417811 [Nephila pilipes]|uniref:Uncharacterized protein n=1 Tax=Nephila pilipes TaxID=299642 RepID=A0A8X6N7X7_NEPPI|nr:hypothetical protein NPIL_417811 [Nephila pilipes]
MTLAFSQSPPSSPNLAPPPPRGMGGEEERKIPEGETSGIPATVTQEFYFILPREQFVCDIHRALQVNICETIRFHISSDRRCIRVLLF